VTESGGDVTFIEASLRRGPRHDHPDRQLGNVMGIGARRSATSDPRRRARHLPTFNARSPHSCPAGVPKTVLDRRHDGDGDRVGNQEPAVRQDGDDQRDHWRPRASGRRIREKALAARRHGIKTFILPARNEADLDELPPEVRETVRFVPVKTLEEVLKIALPPDGVPTDVV
jgi:hypothetical protein